MQFEHYITWYRDQYDSIKDCLDFAVYQLFAYLIYHYIAVWTCIVREVMSFSYIHCCSAVMGRAVMLLSVYLTATCAVMTDEYATTLNLHYATVNITYDSGTVYPRSEVEEIGHYGTTSILSSESGYVHHVPTSSDCSPPTKTFPERWIALMEWSHCRRTNQKISTYLSGMKNASAIVFYSRDEDDMEFDLSRKQKGMAKQKLVSVTGFDTEADYTCYLHKNELN